MSIHAYYKKTRIAVAILSLLVVFGSIQIISFIAYQRIPIKQKIISDSEQELEFIAGQIKKQYLLSNYVEAQNIFDTWAKSNKVVVSALLKAKNGFHLVEYKRVEPSSHHFTVEKIIYLHDRPALTLLVDKDITIIENRFSNTQNWLVFWMILFLIVFGAVLWWTLKKYAFLPIEVAVQVQEKKTASQMKKLSSAVEQTDDSVVITDRNGRIEYANPSFERMTGHKFADVRGKTMAILCSGRHDIKFYQNLWNTILDGKPFSEVFLNRKKDGGIYYEEKTITPIKDSQGEITNFVSTGKDISERMVVQEKLQYMATHDYLTGLLNRVMLKERLAHSMQRAARNHSKVAVMFLDLDKFKIINDTLGHETGDELLIMVADRLRNCLRNEDAIARLGGDEFTIIMEGFQDLQSVSNTASKILKSISIPFDVDDNEIFISTSIGITVYPDDDNDINSLLKNADISMYRAKSSGGNTYQFFTADMTENALRRMKIYNKLQHALENDEFDIYFQPQINLQTGTVSGVEALLRWQHPEMGMIGPDEFIPLLEETGRITAVGEWVFEQACEFLKYMDEQGLPAIRASVNLSARQFRDSTLLQRINKCITQTGLQPERLGIEITESLLVENTDDVTRILNSIHETGIRIDVDDFGTGYSSMSYLKRFPLDILKIDRSFITDIPGDKDDVAIVDAILAMASSLKLGVVAEGVETQEQHRFLLDRDCLEVQGYLYSKPLPRDEFIEWYRRSLTQSVTHKVIPIKPQS